MHLAPLIRDLAVILGVAALVTLLFQRIRQPVVLGYLIAGSLVGSLVRDRAGVQIWAELGVIFLMFSLGLEFSFRKLAKVGISAGFTAGFEVTLMLVTGFGLGRALHWSPMESLFLGAMLSISSTTIILKALEELKLKTRRFAEAIFGLLVVEDLVAVLILVALTTASGELRGGERLTGVTLLAAAGKLVLVMGSWFLIGYFALPRLVRYVGRLGSDEVLTIVALSLCLCLAVAAAQLNYSVALGAFIMGSILAESTESRRIEDLIRPLRDLFAAVFFVSVGMMLEPKTLAAQAPAIALITGVYVLAKICFTTLGALLSGQTFRTSIQIAFGVAQIGEFSFILATLGQSTGATRGDLFPIAVAVSLITTFMTPFLIRISHRFAVWLEGKLPLRWREALSRYAAWTQERRADQVKRKEFYRLLFRWVLNGILVSVVFVVTAELGGRFGVVRFAQSLGSSRAAAALSWTFAALLSAPFIWAMLIAFRGYRFRERDDRDDDDLPSGALPLLMRVLTGFWIGALSLEYFSARSTLLLTLGFMAILFALFYRQIDASYHWFEKRFLQTFEARPKSRRPTDVLRHLAPWDAHLVRIKVHANSEIAGRRIKDAAFRRKYGLSIVAIQRGVKTIVAPGPEEHLYPKDELLVLGTDEQIESVRQAIERPPGLGERFKDLEGYELKQIRAEPHSPWCGRTIAQSGIGSGFGVTIVGLERGEDRVINPDSELVILPGDGLWVVGDTERVTELERSARPSG